MYIPQLSQEILLAIVAGAALLLGAVLARLFSGNSAGRSGEDPRYHRIRQLEADLRLLQRKYDEAIAALDARDAEQQISETTIHELNAQLTERGDKLAQVTKEMRASVAKTRELRQTLADRAAETIREHVRAEEAHTELMVARAGSDVMLSEFELLKRRDAENDIPEQRDLLADESLVSTSSSKP